MDTLKRTVKGRNQVYKIYTTEEAYKAGIAHTHWKSADTGKYALSDDGYVGKCIGRKSYTDKKGRVKTFIRLSYGANWSGNTNKIEYLINKEYGVYTQANPTGWAERESRKTRTKNLVSAYVGQLTSTKQVDYKQLGYIYRPDQQKPAATVRRVLKQEVIRKMVEKKLKEVLSEKGISNSSVLDTMLEGLHIARNKQDVTNMIKISDVFMDLLEMKPNKRITTDTLQLDVASNIGDLIANEEKTLKMSRKVEEDEPVQ
jgi:hypothetical protein|tara:strand:+ start:685 stop:1458 length:774 start_codon:yes stop_codon:yes gene_type:complete